MSEMNYNPNKPEQTKVIKKKNKNVTTLLDSGGEIAVDQGDDFLTCNSGIDIDKLAIEQDGTIRNVILVGTKLDLVKEAPHARQVPFSEAK